jgi:hypothetical protein
LRSLNNLPKCRAWKAELERDDFWFDQRVGLEPKA